MAGAGKSFWGKKLAKKLGYKFLDTDKIIERQNNLRLKKIIDKFGEEKFSKMEEEIVLGLGNITNCVISPGGSVIYSDKAMAFLNSMSKVIFLDVPFEAVKKRLKKRKTMLLIGLRDKTLKQLYSERLPLYKKYSHFDIKINRNFNIDSLVKLL